MPGSDPRVAIVIVNWNGWQDTLECLESVFRNDYPNYQVILCDNGSTDGSIDRIKAWAAGQQMKKVPVHGALSRLSIPPVTKPIKFAEYDRAHAETGGDQAGNRARLIIIRTGANLGYAGGNNVGLRYSLVRDDFAYVWLLNNDTVILPDALSRLVQRMKERPDAGMCGSTVPYYHEPDRIWALGGATYNKWLAWPSCVGLNTRFGDERSASSVEQRLAYIAGASMLVSRDFLKDVGLMEERYFLYFEELDWITRAKGRYGLAYAPDSIVYHKVGASTVKTGPSEGVRAANYYMVRSALLYARRFTPLALPLVALRWSALYLLKQLWTTGRKLFTKNDRS